MSVVGGLAKAAAGAKVLRHTTLTTKVLPNSMWMMVVVLAVVGLALVIPTSQALNAERYSSYSVGIKDYQSATKAAGPVSESGAAPQMSEQEAIDAYKKLPLSFFPNEGQTDKAVRYYAQGAGYGFFFTKGGAMLSFADGKGRAGHALGLDFLGADPDVTLTASQGLSGKVNYLVGDDPANWQQGLPTHSELLYGGLWPGIDMAVRGEGGNLKYEFHVKPGASVEDVRLAYRGAEGLKVGAGGELLIQTSLGILKDAALVSYQLIGGERVPVESRYTLKGDGGGYGFAVGAYDPRYPLIIDPGLDYSTFLGGRDNQLSLDIAVDGMGRAYVTGYTLTGAPDFPTTTGAYDSTPNSFIDAFVTKLNAAGSALAYSTFLGGTGDEGGTNIAVRDDRAYVTGVTSSTDYPTTSGAFDTSFNGAEDAFVTKLNASGSRLAYSTFLGGTGGGDEGWGYDTGNGIAVREGIAYVTGVTESSDFPTTTGAFDTTYNGGIEGGDAFVTKLPTG